MHPRLNDAGLTKANSWQSSANRTVGSPLLRRAGRALGCHRCAVRGSPVGSAVCPSGEPSQELASGREVPKLALSLNRSTAAIGALSGSAGVAACTATLLAASDAKATNNAIRIVMMSSLSLWGVSGVY